MNKIIIAVLSIIIIAGAAGAGYWYLTKHSNGAAMSGTSPVALAGTPVQAGPPTLAEKDRPAQTVATSGPPILPAQKTQQITLYHFSADTYQSTQKTIVSVPQIADATLKELFNAYLNALQSAYVGVSIKDGVATVNFNSDARKYLQAAPGVSSEYTNSITKTLLQFNTITKVQFSITGTVITDWDA